MSFSHEDTLSLPMILAWFRMNLGKIMLGGVICALLATPVVVFKPKTYESVATLLVAPPNFKDRGKPASPKDPAALADTVAEMMPRTLPMEAYKALALSHPVLIEVIHRVPLEGMGAKTLKNILDVELIQMGSRTSLGVTYAQALMLHAKGSTPEEAAKIAQVWSEVFKEVVDKVAENGVGETFALLDTLHSNVREELEQADVALAEHQKAWNLELIKAEIEGKQKQYTQFETDLKQAEVDLAAAEKKLAALQEELGTEPEKKVYFRAPSDDAYWIVGMQDGAQKAGPEKGLRAEQPNTNYVETRKDIITATGEVQSLTAKKGSIVAKLAELDQEIKPLTATLADKTVERNKLSREDESLKASYETVRSEYEKGRMADRTRASDLVIAGEAAAPIEPISPSSPKLIFAAAFLGMLLTAAILVLKKISEMTPAAQDTLSVNPGKREEKTA